MKKKHLLALLSALSLTAGALGLAACTGKSDGSLQAVYETYVAYAQANGQVPKSYEEWLSFIKGEKGEKGKGVKSVKANDDGDLVLTYDDNTTHVVVMPKTYTIYVSDQDGTPLEGVKLRITYLDADYALHDVTGDLTSDKNGRATAFFLPDPNIEYRAEGGSEGFGINGYSPVFEGFGYYATFNDSRTAMITFKNEKNNYFYATETFIPYSRIYATDQTATDGDGNGYNIYKSSGFVNEEKYGTVNDVIQFTRDKAVTAENWRLEEEGKLSKADLSVDYKAGDVKYFTFSPYVAPITEGASEETDRRILNALTAAKGLYRFTVTSSADVRLYQFGGVTVSSQLDKYGVPLMDYVASVTGSAPADADPETAAKYTNTNYIDFNLYGSNIPGISIASSAVKFYLEGEADAEVTITVERIGDSRDTTLETIPVQASATEKWADRTGNQPLVEMPIDGSTIAVLGDDGYYHVNAKTGPILLANLTKTVARFADYPLAEVPQNAENREGAFVLGMHADEDDPLHYTEYDYNAFVAKYATLVNKEGVYGVNEELKTFLELFGGGLAASTAANGCAWLSVCFYEEPEGGLPVAGEGTQNSPYLLNLGTNTVTLHEGEAYIKYVVRTNGLYSFSAENGAFDSWIGTTQLPMDIGGKKYLSLQKGSQVTVKVTGEGSSALVTLARMDTISPLENFSGDVDLSQGTDANHPYTVTIAMSPIAVQMDLDQCKDGMYLRYSAPLFMPSDKGRYVFSVLGGSGFIGYQGLELDELVVELNGGDANSIVFNVYSYFLQTGDIVLLEIKRDDKATLTPLPKALQTGENKLTLAEANEPTPFTFTSAEGGKYQIVADKNSADTTKVSVYLGDKAIVGFGADGTFSLQAGETATLKVSQTELLSDFTLTITRIGDADAPDDTPATLDLNAATNVDTTTGHKTKIGLNFTLTKNKVYTFSATGPALRNDTVTVEIYAADGTLLATVDGISPMESKTYTADRTYEGAYILVSASGSMDVSFNLKCEEA